MGTLLACSHSLPAQLLSKLLAQGCGLRHLGLCHSLPDTEVALELLQPDLLLLEGIETAASPEASRRPGDSNRPSDHPEALQPEPSQALISADLQRLIHHPAIVTGSTRLVLLLPATPTSTPPPELIAAAWFVLRDARDWQELLQRSLSLQSRQPQEGFAAIPPLPDATHFLRLRPYELAVLNVLAAGLSTKEIARQLGLTCSTVEYYRKTISAKLDLSGSQLLRVAVLHQCLQLQAPASPLPTRGRRPATTRLQPKDRDTRRRDPDQPRTMGSAATPERSPLARQRVVPLRRRLGRDDGTTRHSS